jgi:hypothetical protein
MCLQSSWLYSLECNCQVMEILYLTFCGTAKLFSKVATPFYIPTNNVPGFQLLHILTNTCYDLSLFIITAVLWGVKCYLWL